MVHEPFVCINPNSLCMQDGYCGKRYFKQYMAKTKLDANSYPLYRRSSPDNGTSHSRIRSNKTVQSLGLVYCIKWKPRHGDNGSRRTSFTRLSCSFLVSAFLQVARAVSSQRPTYTFSIFTTPLVYTPK